MVRFFSLLVLGFIAVSVHANSLKDFAKNPQYQGAVISPTGKYIAVEAASVDGDHFVAILKTSDMSVLSHIPKAGDEEPFDPVWVSDERIMVRIAKQYGSLEVAAFNGELFAMNADGSKKKALIMHRSVVKSGNNFQEPKNKLLGYAELLHTLPDDNDHVLISFQPWGGGSIGLKVRHAYRLNVYTGQARRVVVSPSKGSHFVLDASGNIVFAIGVDVKNENDLLIHRYKNDEWQLHSRIKVSNAKGAIPIAALSGGDEIILQEHGLKSPDKIYKLDLSSGEKTTLFRHPSVDPSGIILDRDSNELVAIEYDADKPDLEIIDQAHPYSQWYLSLLKAFPEKWVKITSATHDYSQMTLYVYSDNDPGQFHLFDTKQKKLRYLLDAKPWIDKSQLIKTRPIQLKARDGLLLHGYITQPKDKTQNAPMVVLPHGGPHGVRDLWRYDYLEQFLVSTGYAVLRVNFRGSGGYGHGFEVSGYRKWGEDIQYDIIDATKWAIQEKIADPKRICILGASFGGYSALMSSIIEPDLFQCAISYSGIYDLQLMWESGDIKKSDFGQNYLQQVIGDDETLMARYSPVTHAAKLKAPVLLAHGKQDWRVDVAHFYAMEKALKKADHPYKTLLLRREGHGFYLEKNRIKFLEAVKLFLKKYIGD